MGCATLNLLRRKNTNISASVHILNRWSYLCLYRDVPTFMRLSHVFPPKYIYEHFVQILHDRWFNQISFMFLAVCVFLIMSITSNILHTYIRLLYSRNIVSDNMDLNRRASSRFLRFLCFQFFCPARLKSDPQKWFAGCSSQQLVTWYYMKCGDPLPSPLKTLCKMDITRKTQGSQIKMMFHERFSGLMTLSDLKRFYGFLWKVFYL